MVRDRFLFVGVLLLTLAKRVGSWTETVNTLHDNQIENVGGSEGLSDTSLILMIIGGCVVGSIVLVLLCYWCTKGCESFFNCCKRCVMNIHTERKKAKGNKNSNDRSFIVEHMENGETEIDSELVEVEEDAGWTWEKMNSLLNSQGQSLLWKLAPLMDVPILVECVRATIILDWQKDQLMAKQVQYERSDEFLTMMKAGPVENFLRFRYILLKNNQTEVANMLSLPVISPPTRSCSSSNSCDNPPDNL